MRLAGAKVTILTRGPQQMPTLPTKRVFWQFNLSHLLTIIIMVGGLMWTYSNLYTQVIRLFDKVDARLAAVELRQSDAITLPQRLLILETRFSTVQDQIRDISTANLRTADSVGMIQRDISAIKQKLDIKVVNSADHAAWPAGFPLDYAPQID